MDPKFSKMVFAPFKRLHGQNEYEGNGIGLAICRKILVLYNQDIWIESSPGRGAHFRFKLPLKKNFH